MADTHSPQVRSYNMSRIRSTNSKPELILRRALWAHGLRGYRIHKKVVGKPDIVFTRKMIVVFVDGCFWHHCPTCFVPPKSNNDYWDKKILRNTTRDSEVTQTLQEAGYRVLRLWEHQILKDTAYCVNVISDLLKT